MPETGEHTVVRVYFDRDGNMGIQHSLGGLSLKHIVMVAGGLMLESRFLADRVICKDNNDDQSDIDRLLSDSDNGG